MRKIIFAILFLNSVIAIGQDQSIKPGDTSLPTSEAVFRKIASQEIGKYLYSVQDYFRKPRATGFRLSPQGKYMSYKERDSNGKQHVYVKEIATGRITRAIEEKKDLIAKYNWINDDRLVYTMDHGGDENTHIYSTGIDGTKNIDLTPFDGVQADILQVLKDQKDFIIISMNKDNRDVFEPFKVNVVTGELSKLFANTDISNPVTEYDFDNDGNLIGYTKMLNGTEKQYFYKCNGDTSFKLVNQAKWYEVFKVASLAYDTPEPDDCYLITNMDADRAHIVLWDFKANKKIKDIYSDPIYDANLLRVSGKKRKYELDYVGYEGEKTEIKPISRFFTTIYNRLKESFGEDMFGVVGATDNEDRYLISRYSDRLYGQYYLYDVKSKKVDLLFDVMPQLNEAEMAVMKPISFQSRDGKTIYGYITLPKEAIAGKKVPLIVNPHGGPQEERDSWGFNPEAQLFASRGYATLHVNFRISGGYGKQFLKDGFKQLGRKTLDDLEDGVAYVSSKGWVDPKKIAIYGASHGGYATLMSLIKTPDLYVCGIDYVGVSNIETFFKSFPPYWRPYIALVKEVWYDLDNPKEATIAREVSPINHVDRIKSPLLVVQGANDPRVVINESDQIVRALRAKGVDVPYMVKYNEGHGYDHEDSRIELYQVMMGFFAKYLK